MGDDGLTVAGFWALLHASGVERLYRLQGSTNWMAIDRSGEPFTIRDPGDLAPDDRRASADEIIGLHGG